MGFTRTAFVQDVYNASAGNPNAIPAAFSMVEFGKDVALNKDLTDVLTMLSSLSEGVRDTLMALGNEMMHQADECYGYLKVMAKKNSNQNLNDVVKKIASQLKQGSHNTGENISDTAK